MEVNDWLVVAMFASFALFLFTGFPVAYVLGGIGEWMKVAHTAASFNLPVAPHWHANVHAHLVAAAHNSITVEYFALEQDIYNFERLVTPETRLQIKDGHIPLPQGPGIGIELDAKAVDRWRAD